MQNSNISDFDKSDNQKEQVPGHSYLTFVVYRPHSYIYNSYDTVTS